MKHSALTYFLKTPVLDVFSKAFPYRSFLFDDAFAEISSVQFPLEQMLGKQAEFLFEQLLKQSPQHEILDANIQIQGATQTLGELDYLVLNKITKSTIHIELACKFYLLNTLLGTKLPEQCIGPNLKDRLVDKLEKLKNKQFPLLHRSETLSTIECLSVSAENVSQQLCLKAFLFLPLDYDVKQLPEAYRKCVAGNYIKPRQCNILDKNAQYAFPKKKQWLLPEEAITQWVSYTKAIQQIEMFMKEKRSPLVYVKSDRSIRKLFVVWW